MPWKLTLDGQALTADDMTLAECDRVEAETGTDWSQLSPVRTAKHARAIAAVLFARTDPADAQNRADRLTVRELLAGFEVVEGDLPTEFADGIPHQGDGGVTVG